MTTFKILTLAAFTALTLGAGSAMAQLDGGSMIDNWGPASPPIAGKAPPAPTPTLSTQAPQAGSSDVNKAPAPTYDYGDLANPG